MAYGPRLKIVYYDRLGNLSEIFIDQDGYTGAVSVINGQQDAIEIQWGDSSSNEMPVIYGSEATVKFIGTTNFEYSWLYTADARKHKIRFLKDSTLVWAGFVAPENWSEPKTGGPVEVQLTAFDGLGALKDEPFVDGTGADYTGVWVVSVLANYCFSKTGLLLNENYALPFSSNSRAYIDSYYDAENFKGLSCYEVLKQLFPECRIFQREGQWWVISYAAFDPASTTIGYTKKSYTNSHIGTDTVDFLNADIDTFEGIPRMEILPGLKRLTYIQDFGFRENLIENASFEKFDSTTGAPKDWVLTGGATSALYPLNDSGEGWTYLIGRQKPASSLDTTMGMLTTLPVDATTDTVNLSLKCAILGTKGESAFLFIMVTLTEIDNTKHYLYQYGDPADKQIKYAWRTTYDVDGIALQMNYHYIDVPTSRFPLRVNADKIASVPFEDVKNSFEDFKCSMPGLPAAGTLKIQLFVPRTSRTSITGSCWTGVTLDLLTKDEETYPTQRKITITNNSNNNYVPEEKTLIVGDVPDVANKGELYTNALMGTNEEPTTEWSLTGDANTYTWVELIARLAASRQRLPLQSYQGGVMNMLPSMQMAFSDEYNGDIVLLENGITYKDYNNVCDGRYTQLLTVDLTAGELTDLITESEESTNKPSGSSESGSTVIATDEKVRMVGTAGEWLSPAGYLHGDYFEFDPVDEEDETDADLGMALFKPKYARHIESGRVTDLQTRSVEIEFTTPFSDVPYGIGNLRVYRWAQVVSGKYRAQDVRYYFASSANLHTDGFEIEIETSESLTGVIVEYLFMEAI